MTGTTLITWRDPATLWQRTSTTHSLRGPTPHSNTPSYTEDQKWLSDSKLQQRTHYVVLHHTAIHQATRRTKNDSLTANFNNALTTWSYTTQQYTKLHGGPKMTLWQQTSTTHSLRGPTPHRNTPSYTEDQKWQWCTNAFHTSSLLHCVRIKSGRLNKLL